MPKRKSKALRSVPTREAAGVSLRMPYRLTMLIPNKPADGKEDEFIHTRPIAEGEALSITEKYGDRVYLASEQIIGQDVPLGEPVVRLPELLISLGAVPIGSMVISFYDRECQEGNIAELESMGAHLLNDRIYASREALPEQGEGDASAGYAYVMGTVKEKQPQLDWTGEIPEQIEDWVNLRFYAMSILNCCYIGRGAPTGVNLKEQADMISADPKLIGEFVEAISSGMRKVPDMDAHPLPPWQEKRLWEGRLSHHYQKALKQSESFREFFHYRPMISQSHDMLVAEEEFQSINQLMREMIYAYEKGEENNIPDVIWTENTPEQMIEALDEIGAISSIEAYLTGVPLEDIMA